MVGRYELSDDQWEKIQDFLPGKQGDRGRTAVDNQRFVDGVLWILRSGAFWRDMPERYGNWKSAHKRFTRWTNSGVWERIFKTLLDDPKNEYLMLDSTIVCAHQQAATGKGARSEALGRSRGGLRKDPPQRRRGRETTALLAHQRSSARRSAGSGVAGGHASGVGSRRQGV